MEKKDKWDIKCKGCGCDEFEIYEEGWFTGLCCKKCSNTFIHTYGTSEKGFIKWIKKEKGISKLSDTKQ